MPIVNITDRESSASPAAEDWAPVAPYVPGEAKYSDQRYFTRSCSTTSPRVSRDEKEYLFNYGQVRVFRNARNDLASIGIYIKNNASSSEIEIEARPKDLRDIAYRLLDAAHDIEANPAHQLAQVAA